MRAHLSATRHDHVQNQLRDFKLSSDDGTGMAYMKKDSENAHFMIYMICTMTEELTPIMNIRLPNKVLP